MSHQTEIIPASDVARFIYSLRDQRIILDSDLARIYQVPTKALNQAVKRNRAKFPEDFLFQLTPEEAQEARRRMSASMADPAANRSQIVTGSQKHRDPRHLPYAFTEHGALMAATVLNSPRAVAMSVYVIRAFVKMREDLAANASILKRLAEIDKTLLFQDAALRDIYQKLRPLLAPPQPPPRPQIGFHVKEDTAAYGVKKKLVGA